MLKCTIQDLHDSRPWSSATGKSTELGSQAGVANETPTYGNTPEFIAGFQATNSVSPESASIVAGFTPAGLGADLYTAATGEDFFTESEVSGFWRWAGLIPGVSEARKLGKAGEEAITVIRKGVDDVVNISRKQLGKKFKHASDFGLNTTKKNPKTIAEFGSAIKGHLQSTETVQSGTYGFVDNSKVFFNSKTNNAVVLDNSGNFVTGFKLAPGTKQFDNFMKNGVLR